MTTRGRKTARNAQEFQQDAIVWQRQTKIDILITLLSVSQTIEPSLAVLTISSAPSSPLHQRLKYNTSSPNPTPTHMASPFPSSILPLHPFSSRARQREKKREREGCFEGQVIIYFLMGQCNLSEADPNQADLFNSQTSDEISHLSREVISQKDKIMWEHELTISHNFQIPSKQSWLEQIHQLHPCFPQISKDVTRTFPDSSFFGNKLNLDKFQKVLKKVAVYFPQVGYTQGLNFVGGFLLLSGCEEEECYNLLVKMMVHDRILAIGLYEDGFPLNKFYCQLFWIILEKKIPRVYEKLKKINIMDELWLFQWFITFFFYNFPIDFAKRIWDFIISKKEIAPVLVALGLIKTLRNEIMEIDLEDEIDFMEYMQKFRDPEFCKKYLDLKKIFSFANSITKLEIDKAISQVKCNNPYKLYFSSSLVGQKQQWQGIMRRFQSDRYTFTANPQPKKYERNIDVIEHLQKIVLSKYKLYQSQLKKSNGSAYKRSTFSIPFSIRSCKTNNSQSIDFNKKRFL